MGEIENHMEILGRVVGKFVSVGLNPVDIDGRGASDFLGAEVDAVVFSGILQWMLDEEIIRAKKVSTAGPAGGKIVFIKGAQLSSKGLAIAQQESIAKKLKDAQRDPSYGKTSVRSSAAHWGASLSPWPAGNGHTRRTSARRDPFYSAKRCLERAKYHFRDFHARVEEFSSGKDWAYRRERDARGRQKNLKIKLSLKFLMKSRALYLMALTT